ncbi:hypothetical protein VTO42DRAFT_4932 [Malbranchea cinnamomea]
MARGQEGRPDAHDGQVSDNVGRDAERDRLDGALPLAGRTHVAVQQPDRGPGGLAGAMLDAQGGIQVGDVRGERVARRDAVGRAGVGRGGFKHQLAVAGAQLLVDPLPRRLLVDAVLDGEGGVPAAAVQERVDVQFSGEEVPAVGVRRDGPYAQGGELGRLLAQG